MSNDFDYFFKIPFADEGDKVLIPVETQPDGSVSFTTGWGFDYQRDPDPLVDPLTKPVPRDQTNFLMNALSGALGQMQYTGGAPLWSAERAAQPGVYGGTGYPKDARVYWEGNVWTSFVNDNDTEPGTDGPGGEPFWFPNPSLDPTIRAIAQLDPTTNQMVYFTALNQAAVASITSFGRDMLAAANPAAGLSVLGVLAGFSMNSSGINFPNIFGDPSLPANGGLKVRWGSITIPATAGFILSVLPNRCLGGSATIAGNTPSNRFAPQLQISGNQASIFNSNSVSVDVEYILVGD